MATLGDQRRQDPMAQQWEQRRSWWRDHGLLIANLALFAIFFVGMVVTGVMTESADQVSHGLPPLTLGAYLTSGAFFEATFENWESEFLQMGMYIVLTTYLFMRGSSESKDPDEQAPQDEDPREASTTDASGRDARPWPVRRGGWVLKVYEHSLAGVFFLLFAASVVGHAIGGAAAFSEEQAMHGQPGVTPIEYLGTSQFWFESMQNWQSEFLAVALIVLLSVRLRERGSAESKPVAASHAETQ